MNNKVLEAKFWSYPELRKAIEKLNWLSGGVLYEVEAKNRYQRWHFFFMRLNTSILLLELFYFTFLVPFDLLKFITTGIQLILVSMILFLAPWSQNNRSHMVTILNWIATFPKTEFSMKRKAIKAKLNEANKYSILCINFVKIIVFSTSLVLVFGVPAFRYFMMDYGFNLPLDAHLPFLPPKEVFFFFVNYAHQLYVGAFLTVTGTISMGFPLCVFIYIIYFLKIVNILTEDMPRAIKKVGFDNWHESVITNTITVKNHMKIFCHEIYPLILYAAEKVTYAFFIVLWLAVKTDRRLLPWALIGCSITILMVVVVMLNEILLDQFVELSLVLYDQPWYKLTSKEKRSLQMTMIQFQRPICLTTGLQNITFEWLVNLAKAGYSMGVIMDELIKN